jgi:hypothetical protein
MKMVFVCQNIIRLCTHRPKDLTLGRLRDLCYVEPFQPDLTVSQLQSNRTKTIRISGDILAAIGERDQGRLFRSLGKLGAPCTYKGISWCCITMAIHTRVLIFRYPRLPMVSSFEPF